MAVQELFDRLVRITVGNMVIDQGLRSSCSFVKDLEAEPNQASIVLYNLNEDSRSRIGTINPKNEKTRVVRVTIEAGYSTANGLTEVFSGQLITSSSTKSGPTWITGLAAGDGGADLQVARMDRKFPRGLKVKEVLRGILKTTSLGVGNLDKIGPITFNNGGDQITTGISMKGRSSYHLTSWANSCGLNWSVINGVIQFVPFQGSIRSKQILLSPSTGLLGTPVIEVDGSATFKSRIIGGIHPGAVAVIESKTVRGHFRMNKISAAINSRGGAFDYTIKGTEVRTL